MSELKRYCLVPCETGLQANLDPQGPWVSYEDVKELLEALKEISSMKPYNCMECDGGERFIDMTKEALEKVKP